MAELTKALEKAGFKNVQTLLNSGNILFDAPEDKTPHVAEKIEKIIEQSFGFHSNVIIRSVWDMQKLIDADPFGNIPMTDDTQLYVTFLAEAVTATVKLPYKSPAGNFTILRASNTEVCSVLVLEPTVQSTDAMKILEKSYGKNVTTRNWNTVLKLLKN